MKAYISLLAMAQTGDIVDLSLAPLQPNYIPNDMACRDDVEKRHHYPFSEKEIVYMRTLSLYSFVPFWILQKRKKLKTCSRNQTCCNERTFLSVTIWSEDMQYVAMNARNEVCFCLPLQL